MPTRPACSGGEAITRLGQNFLADSNLLDAILSDAAPERDDVVLEVGGGRGVLTERLVESAAHVHLIEIDRSLGEFLEPIAADSGSLTIVWGDAMRVDLGLLDPAPTAMVANLPYSVATPLLLRTIAELPSIRRWTVMVQREIAERLRARPGSRTYGAPSVLVQLSCEVRMLRRVDPAVFVPRPRVDSALLALSRRGPGLEARTRELVRDTFAHRRKAIPRSLELAARRREGEARDGGRPLPRPRPAEIRHRAREALRDLGLPEDARAEMLPPIEHLRLAQALR
jgi:16S rRNA (adenine1518-N6/adenine1519-N6)-dimethyltransferase